MTPSILVVIVLLVWTTVSTLMAAGCTLHHEYEATEYPALLKEVISTLWRDLTEKFGKIARWFLAVLLVITMLPHIIMLFVSLCILGILDLPYMLILYMHKRH